MKRYKSLLLCFVLIIGMFSLFGCNKPFAESKHFKPFVDGNFLTGKTFENVYVSFYGEPIKELSENYKLYEINTSKKKLHLIFPDETVASGYYYAFSEPFIIITPEPYNNSNYYSKIYYLKSGDKYERISSDFLVIDEEGNNVEEYISNNLRFYNSSQIIGFY